MAKDQGSTSADSGVTGKGLQTDVSPIMQPQGSYRFALNAVSDSVDGAGGTLTNEEGNFECANLQGFTVVGSVYMEDNEIALFVTNNQGLSRILVFDELSCGTTAMVTSSCLNFSTDHPIQAIYRKRKGCERVLYFTDDNNPVRAVNIDSLYDYVQQGSTYTGHNSNWDCSQMNLFRDFYVPYFKYEITNDGGGDLQSGTYSFACRYLDEDLNPTNFIAFTDPIPIYRDDLQINSNSIFDVQGSPSGVRTTKSINWEIVCDTRWDYVEVVAIPATGGDGQIDGGVYSVATLPIGNNGNTPLPIGGANNGTVVDFVFRGLNVTGVTQLEDGLDQITIDRNVYSTAKTLTQQANRLILGNVKENYIDHAAFQRAAMNIHSGYKVYTHPYEGGLGANKVVATKGNLASHEGGRHSRGGYFWGTERTYMRDEVYAFGIVWVFNDGSETPVYHIPGRAKNRSGSGQALSANDPNHPNSPGWTPSRRTEHNRMLPSEAIQNTGEFDGARYNEEDVMLITEPFGEGFRANRKHERWQLVNTAIRESYSISNTYPDGTTCFDPAGFIETSGSNAYWESADFTYPNVQDCDGNNVFGTSAGQPIRHHKLPDTTLEPHFYGAQDYEVRHSNEFGNRANYNLTVEQVEDGGLAERKSMYASPGYLDHVANIGFWFDNINVPNVPNAGDIQGYRIVRMERTEADKSVVDKGITFYNHRTATYSYGSGIAGSKAQYCNWMQGDKYCWFYFQGNQYNKNKPMWQVDTCWGDNDDQGNCGAGSGCDNNPYFVGELSQDVKKPSSYLPTGCGTVGLPFTADIGEDCLGAPDDCMDSGSAGKRRTTCISCNNANTSCLPFVLDFFGVEGPSERRANGYPMSNFFLGQGGEIDEETGLPGPFQTGGDTCACGAFITGMKGGQSGDGDSGGMTVDQLGTGASHTDAEYELGNSEIALGCNCGGGMAEGVPVVEAEDEDEKSGVGGALSDVWNTVTGVVNFVVDQVVGVVNFVADIVGNAFNYLFGFAGVGWGDCCGSTSYWWGNRNNSISYHGPKVKFGDRKALATHLKFERILIGAPIRGKHNSRLGTAYMGTSMENKYYHLHSPEKLGGDSGVKSDGGMVADIMDYNVGSRVPWYRTKEGLSRFDTGLEIYDAYDVEGGAPQSCVVAGPNLDAPLVHRKIDAAFHVDAGERVEGVFEVPFDNCKGMETYVMKIGDTGCSNRHGVPFPGSNGNRGFQRVPDDRTSCSRKDGCTPPSGDDVGDGLTYTYWDAEYCSTAYYTSLKRYIPSQYGDLSDAVYIKSSDGVMAPQTRYEDFNGDIHISKMSFRQASHHNKCAGRTVGNPSGNYAWLMTRSLTWYFTESEINTDLRHGDGTKDEWYFPYSYMGTDTEGTEEIYENLLDKEGYDRLYIPSSGIREKYIFTGTQWQDLYLMDELPRGGEMWPQVWNYNNDYSRITKEKKYFPIPLGTDYCSLCPQEYPHRIVYSQQSFQEENVDTYKAFLSGSYKEIPGNTGSINNLFVYNGTLMVLTDESLWTLYKQNSQLQGGPDDLSVLVSRGDFLSDDPRQLLDSNTGYAGSDSQWSLQITEFGPMWVDSRKGKVFHLNGTTPTEISMSGMKNFFNNNGAIRSLGGVSESDVRWDNPLLGYGYTTAYDPRYKRFIITKHDTVGGEDRGFTLSYSLMNQSWTSFHGYRPNHYISGNHSYSGAMTTGGGSTNVYKFGIYEHYENSIGNPGLTTQNYQQYFDQYGGDFIVDLVLNNNPMMTSVTNDVMWVTHAKVYDTTTRQYVDVDDTFTNGILYNSYQSSGKLGFVATNQSPTDILSTSINTVWPQARVNRYERTYKLNEFRDMVSDNTQSIWSSSNADITALYPWYIDKVVNPTAVSGVMPWNAHPRFRDKYLGIRLFFSNFDGSIKLTNNYLISTKTISPR